MGSFRWHRLNRQILPFASWLGAFTLGAYPVYGQISPLENHTVVIPTDNGQIQITGGVSSADGNNLFHQFESFSIDPHETAIFVAPETVENVLGRVSGGEPSSIEGRLAVSNSANLWLINPAGILFGPSVQLDLQGDFSAATATAIGFEQGWFADGADYPVGSPHSFAFAPELGQLINLGNLHVETGQTLRLIGGSVVNRGSLVAPAGTITVAAVDDSRLRLGQTGQLLTLEIEPWTNDNVPMTSMAPGQLPVLLTGQGVSSADTLSVLADGTVQLGQKTTAAPGHVTLSGTVSSAGEQGGEIAVLGDQISLIDAIVNADGIDGGGDIYIGGSYQGAGPLLNATHTRIDSGTVLNANGLQRGDGGQIVVWADRSTYFGGSAQVQGGKLAGDGGFVEISGKSGLGFNGQFSLEAPQGAAGTILFDPDSIRIVGGGTAADIATESALFPNVSAEDEDFGTLTLHAATLESWNGNDNVIFQANLNIDIDLGGNNELTFQPGTGSITFVADVNNNSTGSFSMGGTGDTINTSGRDINISGPLITLESIDTRSATGDGDISLTAPFLATVEGSLRADDITIVSNEINFNGGDASISGTTLAIAPNNPATEINIGPDTNTLFDLDLLESDIRALQDGFADITIGRADGTGSVTLYDSVTDAGTSPFQDAVTVLGADVLRGPAQLTRWTITDRNQGQIDSLFSNGLRFENVRSIAVGNGTNDILQGGADADTFIISGMGIGLFNDITFAGIQNVSGGGGDDRFVVENGAVLSGNIDGGDGTDVLQSSNGADAIALTANNTGTLNGVSFLEIETIETGAGDDTVEIATAGSLSGTLDTGADTDTLDYSLYTTAVTVDLESATATGIGTLNNIETVIGGSASDRLMGTSNNDSILITGNNTGTVNNLSFASIENLDGGAGDDTFFFSDGATVTGVLTGGSGSDTADYSSYTTGITVDLQISSATGTGGLSGLESFVGSSADDTFRLSENSLTTSIQGGAGSDTLQGDNRDSIWNLTGADTGNGPGVDNFSAVENLSAGSQPDRVNFLTGDAGLTGSLNGGDGPLTLTGDSINLGTEITGTDALIIEPLSADRDLRLGGPGLPTALTLSALELAAIDSGFTTLTLGRFDGSGAVTLGADLTLPVDTTIQSPNDGGSIDTQGFDLSAAKLTLSAAQEITTADLAAPGGISLRSEGEISTQALSTRGTNNGGNVTLDAGRTITTQQIDTSGVSGMGGDVALSAADNIQVDTIRAEGGTTGGNVIIATDRFQAVGSFTSLDGSPASISTAAALNPGAITIRHGGNSMIPFEVGDSRLLGSSAALTTGDLQIPIDSSFLSSYRLGKIALLTQDIAALADSPAVASPAVVSRAIDTPAVSQTILLDASPADFQSPLVESDTASTEDLTTSIGSDVSNKALFERLESAYSEQFKSHLNLYERVSVSPTSLETAQETLGHIATTLDITPGVLYVYFLPPANKNEAQPDANGLNPNDELGLLLLTHNGQTIRKTVEGITRREVMTVAADFRAQITNVMSAPSQYLPPAQQLYNWFVAPIENELQQQGVQSLAMAMDTGLRTLPVAALHNGEEFLVERYSLGVIPSFSLTDFNPENFLYAQLENTQLLAMGASQFPSQQVLPAVAEELTTVTQTFRQSKIFLNENFTLDNLKNQVAGNQFGIVHLASHGVFKPGKPSHSYIQLWDQPLQLDQVHSLGLQEADIALMVLSACNTALGDREAEYGFAGLAVNAGVQTSVASLWPISDEGTLGLMTYFYRYLQRQPVRATALRQAQLTMLQGELTFSDGTLYGSDSKALATFPELEYHGRWNFEHPFYWSTYTLVGSPW
ncbi:MAG: CHAT domain-containing protein [Leptolyngbyaceae cyanobacterium]